MIFLTGGTGLLGLHILDELHSRSISATALVRDQAGALAVESRGATPLFGTVENPATWQAVRECQAIIHGAALIAGGYPWARFHQVNVDGARLAGQRARELGVPLVHISSVAVYGRKYQQGGTVDEAFAFGPLAARDFYARSKRLAEAALEEETRQGLLAASIRPCVIYGEGDRLFLPKLVTAIKRARLVPLIGGGTRPLALVHARNVAQAVVLAAQSPVAWSNAYNVTNDDVINARDLIGAMSTAMGRTIKTVNVPAAPAVAAARLFDGARRLLGPSRYPGSATSAVRFWRGDNPYSSEKARRELGWNPTIRHAEGIFRATQFILRQATNVA